MCVRIIGVIINLYSVAAATFFENGTLGTRILGINFREIFDTESTRT